MTDGYTTDFARLEAFADLLGLVHEAGLEGDAFNDKVRRGTEVFFRARLSAETLFPREDPCRQQANLGPSRGGHDSIRAQRGEHDAPFTDEERRLWALLVEQIARAARVGALAAGDRASFQRTLFGLLTSHALDRAGLRVDGLGPGDDRGLLSTAWMQSAYALTRREIELADALIHFRTLKRAATKLCISWETARRHVKSVFDKTGTRSQLELARLILCHPAGLVDIGESYRSVGQTGQVGNQREAGESIWL